MKTFQNFIFIVIVLIGNLLIINIRTGYGNFKSAAINNTLPSIDSLMQIQWEVDMRIETYAEPFIFDSLVFLNNNTEYAIDFHTGEKLYFNKSADQKKIKTKCADSIFVFMTKHDKRSLVNIYTGKISEYHFGYVGCEIVYPVKDNIAIFTKQNPNIGDGVITYDIKTGAVIWETNFPKGGLSISIYDNYIYTYWGNKLDKKTGEVIWKSEYYGRNVYKHGDYVIIDDTYDHDQYYVLDEKDGKTLYIGKGLRLYTIDNNMVFQYKIVYDMQHNKIINWSSDFRGGFGRDCFLYKDILISQECERGVIGVNAYTGEKKYSGLWPLGYDHPNYGGEGRCDQYELYFSRIVDGYIVAVSEFGRVICFKFLK